MKALLYHGAWASLVALIALALAWELWLAPARPGGSWLVLKVLPLLAPLKGVLFGRRYSYQWSAMLILAYFIEGVVRGWSDTDLSRTLAWIECALATVFFVCAIGAARMAAPNRSPRA